MLAARRFGEAGMRNSDMTIRDPDQTPIVVVIDGFGSGGAQRVAVRLLCHWLQHGRRVAAITLRDASADFFELPAGIERIVIGGARPSPNPWSAIIANIGRIIRLRRALAQLAPAAVIAFLTPMNVIAILASIGLRLTLVVSERNDPLRQDPGLQWRLLRRLLYRFADRVTANTVHAVDIMAAYVPRPRLAVVRNPVSLPASGADPLSSRVILNVGRLVPQKGQVQLLQAVSRLGAAAAGWHLQILGDGPLRGELAEQGRRLGIEQIVELPGNVRDPTPFYQSAGIFVMSSLYEGTPNVLLEAMSFGLPCIVPDCLPGALDYVEDGLTGLVYRAGDSAHLAECLRRLISDANLRKRLGDAARSRVAKDSVATIASRWEELLFLRHRADTRDLDGKAAA
jgi:GalNAc-alpha-(1->4)-GalNAc-alpha-(1->3)-diNAcBac-PP-undecaprenol alpha-1,4-N-acetyl-D-galactosaminyltransferase